MVLIYANHNRLALGELSSFDLDFDAAEEKNFELTIDEALLSKNDWIFIPNTEIGGIIDSVIVNSSDNAVKYKGRNFRGILNDKIITVPEGQSYVSAQGDISAAINDLISEAGLSSEFYCLASDVDDVSTTVDYQFTPFCTLYDGIIELANSINFKLIFTFNASNKRVEITPALQENYTDFLTYTKNNSIDFDIEDNVAAVNHLILIGYKEDKRYRIDLYVNENAQIMPYSLTDNPIEDSDYILDSRNQQFFGIDEKAKVEITDNISPVENYKFIETQPSDWNSNYKEYYNQETKDNGDDTVDVSYNSVEPVPAYRQLISQPSDWAQNYSSYYEFKDGDYTGVSGVTTTHDDYAQVKKKPADWATSFGDYYYKESDGLSYYYAQISGISKNYYKKQIFKPTDWQTNWKSYYYVKKKKYTAIDTKKPPKWRKYKFYTQQTVTYAPNFWVKPVYVKTKSVTSESPPAFVTEKFYQKYDRPPTFLGCYKKVLDNFSAMIKSAIENAQILPSNKQEISIVDFEADIGDVVGGYEEKTGIELSAPVINIIYRIERGIQRSIEYVVGD